MFKITLPSPGTRRVGGFTSLYPVQIGKQNPETAKQFRDYLGAVRKTESTDEDSRHKKERRSVLCSCGGRIRARPEGTLRLRRTATGSTDEDSRQKKERRSVLCSCGGRIRTCDLQVMSLASYQLLHSAMFLSFCGCKGTTIFSFCQILCLFF